MFTRNLSLLGGSLRPLQPRWTTAPQPGANPKGAVEAGGTVAPMSTAGATHPLDKLPASQV